MDLSRKVALRNTGGSSILTIPKEFARKFADSRYVRMSLNEEGELIIKPYVDQIDVLAALNSLDKDTVKRMSKATDFELLEPVGKEKW